MTSVTFAGGEGSSNTLGRPESSFIGLGAGSKSITDSFFISRFLLIVKERVYFIKFKPLPKKGFKPTNFSDNPR